MAHFAEIDSDNKVVRVVVIANNDILNEQGVEDEAVGAALCKKLFGDDTNWVQTSYNANKRGVFAGIGDSYDSENDTFIHESKGIEVIEEPVIVIDNPTQELKAPTA